MSTRKKYLFTLFAAIFAFSVVALGAFTRLTDAGLGCPDWPGCYGTLTVPMSDVAIDQAELKYPERPVEIFKAWNEMIHRYLAGTLGVLVLLLSVVHFKGAAILRNLHLAALLLVVFQAALGMWTVTLKLNPIIVMSHLLGGFLLTSMLVYSAYLQRVLINGDRVDDTKVCTPLYQLKLGKIVVVALVALFMQIKIGGWVSTNYAALSCIELPICQTGWQESFTWNGIFNGDLLDFTRDYEFGVLTQAERASIHALHRIGAMIVTALIVITIWRLRRQNQPVAYLLSAILATQITLGVLNIVWLLPLSIAVMHNLVALALLCTMVVIVFAGSGVRALKNNTDDMGPA